MSILVFTTSFVISSAFVLLTSQLLNLLRVGAAYFPDTPIHGLTYGELLAAFIICLLLAYCVGLLNGFVFGRRYVVLITVGAITPILAILIILAAITFKVGLIASPIIFVYGAAVVRGVRRATYKLQTF